MITEELVTIHNPEVGIEVSQHGLNTFMCQCQGKVYSQGFGGWSFGTEEGNWIEKSWMTELLAVCGVSSIKKMEGIKMLALREGRGRLDDNYIIDLKNPVTGAEFRPEVWATKIQVMDRMVSKK